MVSGTERDDFLSDSGEVLEPEDSLEGDDWTADPLEKEITVPERWTPGMEVGTYDAEDETLDQKLAEEEPEPDPYAPVNPRTWEDEPAPGGISGEQVPLFSDDAVPETGEEAAVHVTDDDAV